MLISDWSSDVCSSDLCRARRRPGAPARPDREAAAPSPGGAGADVGHRPLPPEMALRCSKIKHGLQPGRIPRIHTAGTTRGARAMRLDDFDPNINVEDQRGRGGGGFGGGGGGLLFSLLPLIGSRFGCGGIAVGLVLFAVFGGVVQLGNTRGGPAGGGRAPTTDRTSVG